jgi:hypothetical protein
VNPQLTLELQDPRPPLDEHVVLQIAIASSVDGSQIQIDSETPLYYMTNALSFDRDGVMYLRQPNATLNARLRGMKVPDFPAPPAPARPVTQDKATASERWCCGRVSRGARAGLLSALSGSIAECPSASRGCRSGRGSRTVCS